MPLKQHVKGRQFYQSTQGAGKRSDETVEYQQLAGKRATPGLWLYEHLLKTINELLLSLTLNCRGTMLSTLIMSSMLRFSSSAEEFVPYQRL
jgi:hypothetical protein